MTALIHASCMLAVFYHRSAQAILHAECAWNHYVNWSEPSCVMSVMSICTENMLITSLQWHHHHCNSIKMQLLTEETPQSKGREGQVLSQKRLLYMYCTRAVSYLALYCIVGNFCGVQISFFPFSVYHNENLTHEMYVMMGVFSCVKWTEWKLNTRISWR